MKKTCLFCFSVFLALQLIISPMSAFATGVADTQNDQVSSDIVSVNSCKTIDADMALLGTKKIVDNARSVFLYEATSDTLMYMLNQDDKMHPASIVKIMTALLAIESGSLDAKVTVTQSAVASVPYDAVSADLVADEQLTLSELIYCLIVGSANDAAAVIAEHIGGTQSDFVNMMNQRAAELGCTGTQYTNVHGLHDEQQYTTARDAARVLSAALKNETFRSVFTTNSYKVSATNKSEERNLTSGNFLKDATSKLYYDPRVIGGRTGVTGDGRRVIAAAAEQNGMLLISVIMGAESVYQEDGYSAISIGGYKETTTLLNAGFGSYMTAQLLHAGQSLRQLSVPGGNSDLVIGPQTSVSAILPEGITLPQLSFRFTDDVLQFPIVAGQKVSHVQIWHGNMCIAETDLFAMNGVESIIVQQPSDEQESNVFPWASVIWTVLGAGLGGLLVFVLLRFSGRIKRILYNIRRRKYRRSHRRTR